MLRALQLYIDAASYPMRWQLPLHSVWLRAVQDVVQALYPNPNAHLIGFGDNFFSTELLSERQARQRLEAFHWYECVMRESMPGGSASAC